MYARNQSQSKVQDNLNFQMANFYKHAIVGACAAATGVCLIAIATLLPVTVGSRRRRHRDQVDHPLSETRTTQSFHSTQSRISYTLVESYVATKNCHPNLTGDDVQGGEYGSVRQHHSM